MSKTDKTVTSSQSDEIAWQIAEIMSKSFAMMIPSTVKPEDTNNPPEPPTTYNIDTQPLHIGGNKLNGENYSTWAVLIHTAISDRGMVSHITGVPPPAADRSSLPAMAASRPLRVYMAHAKHRTTVSQPSFEAVDGQTYLGCIGCHVWEWRRQAPSIRPVRESKYGETGEPIFGGNLEYPAGSVVINRSETNHSDEVSRRYRVT